MTVPIATRKSWGARHDDGDLTLSGLASEVFAHHSVTKQLPATATVEQERAAMRELEAIGQSRFGTGISYNVGVFPSGRAYQGASWNRRGTHTGGRNSTARSIVFIGNYETNEPTAAQLATAAEIYREGKGKWWTPSAPLRGHRDVKGTACPGKNVYSQLPAIRAGKITTTQQEDPDMNATQAKQLSDIHAALAKLDELHGGIAPQIPVSATKNPEWINFRAAVRDIRIAVTRQMDDAVAQGVAVALQGVTGVDKAALTAGVVAEVRKVLDAVGDREYVLTPKES